MVQILVVVAITQARTLRAEAEKGFSRTALARELVDPKLSAAATKRSIGREPVSHESNSERELGTSFPNLEPDRGRRRERPRRRWPRPRREFSFLCDPTSAPESHRAEGGLELGNSTPAFRGVRAAAVVP